MHHYDDYEILASAMPFDGRGKMAAPIKPQPLDVIEGWNLGHHEAVIVTCIARARFQGGELEQLREASRYLNRKIALLGGQTNAQPSADYELPELVQNAPRPAVAAVSELMAEGRKLPR